MEQYISKSALLAEIERRINAYQKNFDKADNKIARLSIDGRIQGLKAILSFINTLEVKEVDIDKEIGKFFGKDDWKASAFEEEQRDMIKFAEHFFELGMQQSKKHNNN